MWFPVVFISALDKIVMDVKKQSAYFFKFIFSRLWYMHAVRIRGCHWTYFEPHMLVEVLWLLKIICNLDYFSCRNIQQWNFWGVGWLCWGLTSQSTIFQSYRDGAIASWVINQYFRGVKCLAQGHNTAAVGLEPRTSRSGVRHSTTEPPRSPLRRRDISKN